MSYWRLINVYLLVLTQESYYDIAIKSNGSEKIKPLQRISLFTQTSFNLEKAAPFFKFLTYGISNLITRKG